MFALQRSPSAGWSDLEMIAPWIQCAIAYKSIGVANIVMLEGSVDRTASV